MLAVHIARYLDSDDLNVQVLDGSGKIRSFCDPDDPPPLKKQYLADRRGRAFKDARPRPPSTSRRTWKSTIAMRAAPDSGAALLVGGRLWRPALRSGPSQVRFITRPKSRTMRAKRKKTSES
jgi:hypothetical protein